MNISGFMRAREARALDRLDDGAIVRALKALADPIRFRIVQEVARGGELTCGQVVECFDVSQPTISHHMKILADAGLLLQRSEGKHHFMAVNHELVAAISDLLPRRLASKRR
jgi:ArsR family transcriptional regulator